MVARWSLDGRSMVAEDLWAGAHYEYTEMGKVMPHMPMRVSGGSPGHDL